jgi:hypothetical protein
MHPTANAAATAKEASLEVIKRVSSGLLKGSFYDKHPYAIHARPLPMRIGSAHFFF